MKTTNSLSEFIAGYRRATSRVSGMPKPMSEFELMPLFELPPEFEPPTVRVTNTSVLRPTMVMDLVHCLVNNDRKRAATVFEYYNSLLRSCYERDVYSDGTNLPVLTPGITVKDVKDSQWFKLCGQRVTDATARLNEYLLHSYSANGDIFADETYEVLGPFSIDVNKVAIVRRFHVGWVAGGTIDFIIGGQGRADIDMFGHTSESFVECSKFLAVLINGDFVDVVPPVPEGIVYRHLDAGYLYSIHLSRHGLGSEYAKLVVNPPVSLTGFYPDTLITFLEDNLS